MKKKQKPLTKKDRSASLAETAGSAIQRRFTQKQWDYLLTSEQEAHKQTMGERNKMVDEIEYCIARLHRWGGDMVIEKRLRLSLPNIAVRHAEDGAKHAP